MLAAAFFLLVELITFLTGDNGEDGGEESSLIFVGSILT
jgi:hypothetical protein